MKLVPHATEFELFDRSFLNVLREINPPNPFLRGLINKYGKRIELIKYTQDRRANGKSHFNVSKYYDFAVNGIVSTSRCVPRRMLVCVLLGLLASALEFFVHFIPSLAKLESMEIWNGVFLRVGVFVLLLEIAALAVMFEYVIALANNASDAQGIVEEKRINF